MSVFESDGKWGKNACALFFRRGHRLVSLAVFIRSWLAVSVAMFLLASCGSNVDEDQEPYRDASLEGQAAAEEGKLAAELQGELTATQDLVEVLQEENRTLSQAAHEMRRDLDAAREREQRIRLELQNRGLFDEAEESAASSQDSVLSFQSTVDRAPGRSPAAIEMEMDSAPPVGVELAAATGGAVAETRRDALQTRQISEKTGTYLIDVYYATDRKNRRRDTPLKKAPERPKPQAYGNVPVKKGEPLNYGKAVVSVPPDQVKGTFKTPVKIVLLNVSIYEEKEESDEHILVQEGPVEETKDAFFKKLAKAVRDSKNKDVFLFIHGFNVTFENAILRSGQLGVDLDLDAPVVTYSWASNGKVDFYLGDIDRSELTEPRLKAFIKDLKKHTECRQLNVVAHSMGNRAFAQVMAEIGKELAEAKKQGATPVEGTYFNQVVMASPDIQRDVFDRNVAPHIKGLAKRFTIYGSAADTALYASNVLRRGNGASQLGLLHPQTNDDVQKEVITYEGFDYIDTTGGDPGWLGFIKLNHSDYGAKMIYDLHALIREGKAPGERVHLVKIPNEPVPYWKWKESGQSEKGRSELRTAWLYLLGLGALGLLLSWGLSVYVERKA